MPCFQLYKQTFGQRKLTQTLTLVVAMKDGRVHSFDLENTEEKAPSGFTSFLTQQLGMLISMSLTACLSHSVPVTSNSFSFFSVMLGTIALFVINEVKNYPSTD